MPRTNSNEFGVYKFEVEIRLARSVDRYNSDTLVSFDQKQERPFASDTAAKEFLAHLVDGALDIATGIVEARIDFEDTVRRLEAGDVLDASDVEY